MNALRSQGGGRGERVVVVWLAALDAREPATIWPGGRNVSQHITPNQRRLLIGRLHCRTPPTEPESLTVWAARQFGAQATRLSVRG